MKPMPRVPPPAPLPRDLLEIPLPAPSRPPPSPPRASIGPGPVTSARPTARPTLREALKRSLIAPAPAQPLTRGLGLVTMVVAALVTGLVDGVLALARAPAPVPGALKLLVPLHCAAVLGLVGVFGGLFGDALLAASMRLVPLRALGGWLLDGPRRWFARDPRAAHRVLLALVAVGLLLGPVFPASYFVVTRMRSQAHMALAITLATALAVPAAAVLLVFLASPLRWLTERAGRFASPGAVLVAASALGATEVGRFMERHEEWFRSLSFGAPVLAGVILATCAAGLFVLGRWRDREHAPLPWRWPAVATGAALACALASGLTLGAYQNVAVTVLNHGHLAPWVARAAQAGADLDRDGHSALFSGGDCDDLDARRHPGAPDAPGNGVDENCSGADAAPWRDDTDGHLVPVAPVVPGGARPSFLLVTIDTLRPDHLGAYGYRRPTSPNLDAFARGAARFDHAYCTSPRTLRSISSIFTGLFPSRVEWGNPAGGFPPLEAANTTLAERLHAAGYATAAFNNSDFFHYTRGFYQGFTEVHQDAVFKGDTDRAVDRASAWIRARAAAPEPFFGWLHLLDPHTPYRDHDDVRNFGREQIDLYDEEIAYTDRALARVLAAADAAAAGRPLVVIVTADHGEAFGEHRVFHHQQDMHEEAVRVPLLIRGPGIAPGARAALTSLLDLHPTVLNYAGLRPLGPLHGRSLVTPLQRPATPHAGGGWREQLFMECMPDRFARLELKTVIAPPLKLTWNVHDGTWELFDLDRDPGELENLIDSRGDTVGALRERLYVWSSGSHPERNADLLAAARLRAPPRPQTAVGARVGDALELLGYDLPSRRVPAGGEVRATFYYRALRRTEVPLRVGLSLQGPAHAAWEPYLHFAHHPVLDTYRTTAWTPGELLRDEVVHHLDAQLPPGRVSLRFALERDGVPVPGAALDLGPLEITAP